MTQTAAKPQPEITPQPGYEETLQPDLVATEATGVTVQRVRMLWNQRRLLTRAVIAGLVAGTLLAFLLPKRYESSTQLMPPDSQSSSGMAMMAGLAARTGNGLGAFAGDLLGLKSSGALFIGILRSRTVEDRLVDRFNLKKVYWVRLEEAARRKLAENTAISEDRKS